MVLGFVDRRSSEGFEATGLEDRSTDRREACNGDGESDSHFVTPRLSLLILGVVPGDAFLSGVANDALLLGVSDKVDLSEFNLLKRIPFLSNNEKS